MQNEDTSLQSSPQLAIGEQSGVVVALSGKQILSLYKKSEQSGVPFDTLKEVYQRGYAIDFSEQTAYNRVNSFIAGGAAQEMDKDLLEKRGLWDNIWAKRKRIAAGSGERMRKPGSKGAPTAAALKASQTKEEVQVDEGMKEKIGGIIRRQKEKDSIFQTRSDIAKLKAAHHGSKDNPKDQRKSEKYDDFYYKHQKSPHNYRVKEEADYHESYTGAEKVSKNPNDPSNRFIGTTSLTDTFKKATPGQSSTLSTIKKVVKEMTVPAGTTGKRKEWNPPMVGIRMASGKIEKHPPGKSGSSGGGGNGGE
jgi:hypothetical protein